MIGGIHLLLFSTFIYIGLQICLEESTHNGIAVKWATTLPATNIISNPVCYHNGLLVTRNCTGQTWVPSYADLPQCVQVENNYNLSGCPPGFNRISKHNTNYCYQISLPTEWNYPCLKSGGASVITDLSDDDAMSLLQSLKSQSSSRYFWLPAKRQKFLHPVTWHIPGQKWGHNVESKNFLKSHLWFLNSCLLLDIEEFSLITGPCTEIYPSLCFYINDLHYPAKCPEKYHSIRYLPDDGICLGIEQSDTNLTFNDFIEQKCQTPMGDRDSDLTRFIYKMIAKLNNLPDDVWCWFTSVDRIFTSIAVMNINSSNTFLSINKFGEVRLNHRGTLQKLSCMACQTEVIYPEAELDFEYNEKEKLIFLTIYHPSSLWKYNQNDRGVQCFSDAKGFVKVVDMEDYPLIEINQRENLLISDFVDKTVYAISLFIERSAQYWCEGHTKNFSLITTNKLVVNPLGKEVHVFSLVIKIYISTYDVQEKLEILQDQLINNIISVFHAKKVLLMEYLEYSQDYLMILLHLDVDIKNIYDDNAKNIKSTYEVLYNIAESQLSKYNYIFVNISSSVYCLPTTSHDNTTELNWELTPIRHIAAPKEFCLQKNGLPVKRVCSGSYLLGSIWGNVEGSCDQNYKPTDKTTFLYNFVKGQMPENDTSRFLTDGLGFVLNDVKIIIPADIYYLSISLKQILNKAQENHTKVDMGSMDNIAWAMDRVMLLDKSYLRLAQTMNSTNVILDSVGGIINRLAVNHIPKSNRFKREIFNGYEFAVRPRFILQVSYPYINNISGIVVTRSSRDDSFVTMRIEPLFLNTTLEDVLSIKNLEIATWLPANVLNSLKKINYNESSEEVEMDESIYIVVSVFHNDGIFQDINDTAYDVNSRIVGVALPPGIISNLEEPIPLIYRNLVPIKNKLCGYWDFQTNLMGSSLGHWSSKGCYLKQSNDNFTVCQCYHLTHFGQLIDFNRVRNNSDPNIHHAKPLNIISLIGSFLSLIGIMCIWITACVFHTWRKKAGTKVLLHLSTSIAFPLVIMIVFNLNDSIFVEQDGADSKDRSKILCITLGAALHYSVLASFMWMLITAVLQFIRYVRVLGVYRPSRFMIKFTLIGWGIPLIPVIIVLVLDKENYLDNSPIYSNLKYAICYPSGFYFIVTVVVPICIILLTNITLFILVMYAISKGPDGKMRTTDLDLIGAQLRLSIFLIFLLGLTWIFGIFSFSNNLIWSYLFCLTSTMQGFVLFVYFIICDSQTRNLWVTLVKPQFRSTSSSSRESIVSLSSN